LTVDCKKLAPIWETLAEDFALEPSVLIAKVDAEAANAKATAKEQGVQSYPTIKYFPKGSKVAQAYEGGRSEADFISFLNKNAGTHRAVGGGLDTTAGTIEVLDAVVAKFMSGASLASIAEEAQKAAKSLKDTYAAYYVKVFEKLAKSEGYVQKELARLSNILNKGGLAPAKMDDITIRKNILSKFLGGSGEKDEL
jgi:protein disulfide-isomerase A6